MLRKRPEQLISGQWLKAKFLGIEYWEKFSHVKLDSICSCLQIYLLASSFCVSELFLSH